MKHEDPNGDPLGDRVKALESVEAKRRIPPGCQILVRLDGRAFHTFTRGLARPFDLGFRALMEETARACAEETGAVLAYTQSDEITLVLPPIVEGGQQGYFGGRLQKMTSVLAARASVVFNALMPKHLPQKAESLRGKTLPVFDCRVWSVPTRKDAVEAVLWREIDARVNAVFQVAQTHFSHRELERTTSQERKEMLREKGVEYRETDLKLRRGFYLQRRRVTRPFTAEEISLLPALHAARKNPDLKVERSELVELDMPPFAFLTNPEEVLFDGAAPVAQYPEPVSLPPTPEQPPV